MLILVRHGESEANAGGLLAGRADFRLTPAGVAGARRAGAYLRDSLSGPITIVTSPLERARVTADLLAGEIGEARTSSLHAFSRGDITVDDRWIEMDYGVYDGLPASSVPTSVWSAWMADPGYRPEGGESLNEVGLRVRAACIELSDTASESDVIVVSHVSPIKAAVAWALGVGDCVAWRLRLDPASVSTISIQADGREAKTGGRPGNLRAILHGFNQIPPAGPASSSEPRQPECRRA